MHHMWYLGKGWFPCGTLGRTEVRVLVRCGGSGCPLICIAQRCEVTTVLNAGAPLKLLTHAVPIKNITLTRFTLGKRIREEDLWKNIKSGFLIWQSTLSFPTDRPSSSSICQWTKNEQIYSLFSLATSNVSHISSTKSDSPCCQHFVNSCKKWTLTSINYWRLQ